MCRSWWKLVRFRGNESTWFVNTSQNHWQKRLTLFSLGLSINGLYLKVAILMSMMTNHSFWGFHVLGHQPGLTTSLALTQLIFFFSDAKWQIRARWIAGNSRPFDSTCGNSRTSASAENLGAVGVDSWDVYTYLLYIYIYSYYIYIELLYIYSYYIYI